MMRSEARQLPETAWRTSSTASMAITPPLAVVVGAHDQDGVLERDDQDERPEDERDGAGDALRRQRAASVGGLFEGIKRACADVAVHDPERGEGGTRECLG